MRHRIRTTLAFAAALLASFPGFAQSAPPSADTFSDATAPAHNFGTQAVLAVTANNNTYLQFDLSALPAGATVAVRGIFQLR